MRITLMRIRILIGHFDADPDPACHVDPDPDPIFHFYTDPDPDFSFQINYQKNLEKVLK
jgi:hypothetical protein